PAAATVYELPENGSAVFGTDERIKSTYQDTLLDIERRMPVHLSDAHRIGDDDRLLSLSGLREEIQPVLRQVDDDALARAG
ncbi:hypothetical protein Q5762_39415, partial [Streptomyces sp. P9(2023)]|uniref:hypothetical protein n=1 Tax=Streptomyces sp. P9(2023) TaxID=3064394 RepID=UPI0028F41FDD